MAKAPRLPETGPELKALREKAGVSASDLAGVLKYRNERLSRIENAREKVPSDLPERYCAAVLKIATERAKKVVAAVGAA